MKTGEWEHLQDLLARFDAAWQQTKAAATSVDLNEFLPPPGHPFRSLSLCELLKSDLENRWRRGRAINLEDYVGRFPELGTAADLPAELIYEEYRVRQRYGDKLSLTAYEERFPRQFTQLQRLVQAKLTPSVGDFPTFPTTIPAQQPKAKDRSTQPASAMPAVPPPSQSPSSESSEIRELLPIGSGYKLIKCIGRGGFGKVYRAEAPGGVEIAIKVINGSVVQAEGAKREQQALELMRGLHHAYLLPVHASWQLEEQLIIAMELADGSLKDAAKQMQRPDGGGVRAEDLIHFFREAAEAIDYLHSKDVIHRDIKPENILVLSGHAKVADFGLARALEQSRGLMTISNAGTPFYMAPEILMHGKIGEQSDQFSLATAYAELRLESDSVHGPEYV